MCSEVVVLIFMLLFKTLESTMAIFFLNIIMLNKPLPSFVPTFKDQWTVLAKKIN